MLEALRHLDHDLFIFLNSHRSAILDPFMIMISNRFFWFPAYGMLIFYLIYNYRRRGILMVVMLLIAVLIADTVSSDLFKPFFARLRPCHDPELSGFINIVSGCGGRFGFMSSHAANTFCMAIFFWLLLPYRYFWFKISLFCWAFAVSYSRIYLGVHFPGDVFAGALLGSILGWLVSLLYFRMERFSVFRN